MVERDKGSWVIVGVLFATLFLIWGPINASGVFFLPVVKHFGWSRALFSTLVATGPLAAGISSPAIGWLLERIGVRPVMIAGATMVAGGYVTLSQANSAAVFFVVFLVMGVGITASTIIPTALVITRWFRDAPGLALGIAFAGIPLGGTGISGLANYMVLNYGFRSGYLAMALPILLIVIPLLVTFLRIPAEHELSGAARPAAALGLEVGEALVSRSFWMIAIAEIFYAAAGVGVRVHLVPYLTGIGYTPTLAAEIFGAMFIFSAMGNLAIGPFGDRFGGRSVFAVVLIVAAIGITTLLGASHLVAIAAFTLIFGLVRETPPVLAPMVIGESLGTRRLGALLGIQAFFTTLGFAAGPIIAGRIFDASGSYSAALLLFAAMALASAIAIHATLPLSKQRARIEVRKTVVAPSALS